MRLAAFFAFQSAGFTYLALSLEGVFLALLWPAATSVLLCAAYFGLGPAPFGKRPDGTMQPLLVAISLPYFAAIWSIWHVQRLLGEPPFHEIAPGLLLGRRPLPGELPADVDLVVDLTCEFPEPAAVRTGRQYRCLPTLDGFVPDGEALRALAIEVARFDGRIYIHCAQGHGRSATLAAAVLLERGLASSVDEAEAMMKRVRPGVRLHSVQRVLLMRLYAPRTAAAIGSAER